MKFIIVKSDFKHDSQQYFAGERRNLTDELADYFIACGWAVDALAPATLPPESTQLPAPVTLEVHGGKHSLKASKSGSK